MAEQRPMPEPVKIECADTVYVRFERGRDDVIGPTFGPYEFLQVTYTELRVSPDGDPLATFGEDGDWHLHADPTQCFSDFILMAGTDKPGTPGPFPEATPEHQARFIAQLNALLNDDNDEHIDRFTESLEGYAAAAAAASMLVDWEQSDDGTGYFTAEVKRGDVQSVIEILQKWAKTLTDTPAKEQA